MPVRKPVDSLRTTTGGNYDYDCNDDGDDDATTTLGTLPQTPTPSPMLWLPELFGESAHALRAFYPAEHHSKGGAAVACGGLAIRSFDDVDL